MARSVREIQDHRYSVGEEAMVDRRLESLGCSVVPGPGRCDRKVTTQTGYVFLLDNKGGQTRSGGLYGDRVVYSGIVQAALDKAQFRLPVYLSCTGRMPLPGGRREQDLQAAIRMGLLDGYVSLPQITAEWLTSIENPDHRS